MHPRLLHHHDIVARRGGPLGIAAPSDFTLAFRHASGEAALPAACLAYCLDLPGERMLFTRHEPADVAALFAAPFLFVAQLHSAAGIVSVPFERLAELAAPDPLLPPLLVFSPGRTGSTLLARLLQATGLAAASEPDVLTQVALLAPETCRHLPDGTDTLLAAACLGALSRTLGRQMVVKLRSQCNERPLALLAASPRSRVVFMLRGAAAWGLSRHRAFGEDAEIVAVTMRQAFNALDALFAAGIACDVVWFEDLLADPRAALRLCAPGRAVQARHLARIMDEDSQEGTVVAREALKAAAVQHGFVARFAEFWVRSRAGIAWSARTEALVAEMVRR